MADKQRFINPLLELCHIWRLLQLLQYRVKRYILKVKAVSGSAEIYYETISIISKTVRPPRSWIHKFSFER